MVTIVWFKRDLRIHDNAALNAAAASGEPILPLYILEPELWRQPELSGRHYAFLQDSLRDLDSALAKRGARLVVRVGEAVGVFASLHKHFGVDVIHAHEETGLLWTYERDKAVTRWAKKAGVAFVEHRQHGVLRRLRNRDGWAARWEKFMRAAPSRAPATLRFCTATGDDTPDSTALGIAPDPCPQRQHGGRVEGVRLLKSFLAERGRDYRRAMSTPLDGAAACSRVSAHLALGCLSMRETFQAALHAQARWREEGDAAFSGSVKSFIARLHWHCHFIQKLEDEPELQHRDMHKAYVGLRPIGDDHAALVDAWEHGRTGFPFVDACMRSLRATGWINFRMRSMAMAFSSYHLWQDWRLPAQRLARLFTDFEPGIHYPQAQMQSGVTGVNTARIYNPVKQSYDQDPDGVFIRTWTPELSALPTAFIHEPWKAPTDLLAKYNIRLGETYPTPLVDHVAAAASARTKIYGVRKGQSYHDTANAVQEKHGSRKSGLPQTRKRRRIPAKQALPKAQQEFKF